MRVIGNQADRNRSEKGMYKLELNRGMKNWYLFRCSDFTGWAFTVFLEYKISTQISQSISSLNWEFFFIIFSKNKKIDCINSREKTLLKIETNFVPVQVCV